jgi:hypothetical protein
MNKINSGADLRNAITRLEIQQEIEANVMKEHLKLAYNSIKPINLIKSIFSEASGSEEIKGKIESTTAGLAAGLITKVVFQGASKNPVKRLLGTALMFGVTNLVAKNPDTIKLIAQGVMKVFKRKKIKTPLAED